MTTDTQDSLPNPTNTGETQGSSQYQRLKRRLHTVLAEYEQLRQQLEAKNAELARIEEAKRTAELKAEESLKRAELESRRAAKFHIVARKAPNLLPLADYIPTTNSEEEQEKAIEAFLASLESIVGSPNVSRSQPTPTNLPAHATPPMGNPEPSIQEVQDQLIKAIHSGDMEKAAQLNGLYYQLLAKQTDEGNWKYQTPYSM